MRVQMASNICIGGFVTLLARTLDIELLDDFQPVDNTNILDSHALMNMHHILK